MNPDCSETDLQRDRLHHLLRELPPSIPPKEVRKANYDVIIVGAGASGIGVGLMLTETFRVDKSRVLIIERGKDVGESFRRWPEEMKFISPSFNQQVRSDPIHFMNILLHKLFDLFLLKYNFHQPINQ